MRTHWWIAAGLGLLCGCEEVPDGVDELEALAPVEVGETRGDAADETAALQARIATLEHRLSECEGGSAHHHEAEAEEPDPGGTQVAAVPEGVDVPDDDTGSEAATDTGNAHTHSGSSHRRRNDRGLLGVLLGDDESGTRRRRRGRDDDDDDRGVVLNPADILLGR